MLSEDAKGILYNLCIMEKSCDLANTSWSEIACFCHIHTDKMLNALIELKEEGYIDFTEYTHGYKKFKILEKGFKESEHYLSGGEHGIFS